jgi:hypothetical protein
VAAFDSREAKRGNTRPQRCTARPEYKIPGEPESAKMRQTVLSGGELSRSASCRCTALICFWRFSCCLVCYGFAPRNVSDLRASACSTLSSSSCCRRRERVFLWEAGGGGPSAGGRVAIRQFELGRQPQALSNTARVEGLAAEHKRQQTPFGFVPLLPLLLHPEVPHLLQRDAGAPGRLPTILKIEGKRGQ